MALLVGLDESVVNVFTEPATGLFGGSDKSEMAVFIELDMPAAATSVCRSIKFDVIDVFIGPDELEVFDEVFNLSMVSLSIGVDKPATGIFIESDESEADCEVDVNVFIGFDGPDLSLHSKYAIYMRIVMNIGRATKLRQSKVE